MSSIKKFSGDDGTTGYLGAGRILKSHPRIQALGSLDEASAALGLARAMAEDADTAAIILELQRDLYHIMSTVAAPPGKANNLPSFEPSRVAWLDTQINQLEARVQLPNEFILPGESMPAASFALARTIVRRAERNVTELVQQGEISNEIILPYLNRLSFLCYLLELDVIHTSGRKPSLAKKKNDLPEK